MSLRGAAVGEADEPPGGGSGLLGDDLQEVAVGVSQQRVAVAVADVVRLDEAGCARGSQPLVCRIDVVAPDDDHHRRRPGCGVDAVHGLGCLDVAQTERETVQDELDVGRDTSLGVRKVSVNPSWSR